MAKITFFECSRCKRRLDANLPQTVCDSCGGVLYVRYDLQKVKAKFKREQIDGSSMWRYQAILPDAESVSLGEGYTPLLRSRKYKNCLIKDEGLNPTGSFKARGLCLAVTMARHYGLKKLAIPSAGNAAGALAAYAAAGRIEAHIFMPEDVPQANIIECECYGAHINLVDGFITDCARALNERKEKEGWFDVSALKEPFRAEGKKTMGYEIAEQLGWKLPDVIVYPAGGGVGLIGIAKAIEEMEELGWVNKGKRPKLIAVQSEGCAPIAKAFMEGKAASDPWVNAQTIASGLRVPKAYGDYIILDIIRQSHGTVTTVSDAEIMEAVQAWGRDEGIFASPEGAASLAAYRKLLASGLLSAGEEVVLFNTGTGIKYVDVFAKTQRANRKQRVKPAPRHLGGIIGPY